MSAEQGRPRVLVVDDDADSCDIMSQVLHHLGYAPVCVQDSIDALPRLMREQFDLVLLDLVMPGLSGFDLLRAAPAEMTAPMIAVSSHNEYRHKATELGFHAFIEKPVELSKLRPVLNGILPGT